MTSRTHTHASDTVFASGAASERKEAHAESAAQVRSIIDRILRLKAEQDELAADVREVYAEAKASGFDKTALGMVVSSIRKRDKDRQRHDELSALADLYLTAYESGTIGATRVHSHTHEKSEPASGYLTSAEDGRGRQPPPTPAPGRSNPEIVNSEKEATSDGSASAAAPVDANSGARVSESAPAFSPDDLEIPEFLRRGAPVPA